MWSYEEFLGKAEVYFTRMAQHPRSDDDEFGLWALLGLEFLLRAPLAQAHPSLLAAMDGDSLMHANGYTVPKDPKSVPTHTVIHRLQSVVPNFDAERQRDATDLMNLRNTELHTSDAAIANVSVDIWLPRLLRVAEVICDHLGLDATALLSRDVVDQARALVDAQDTKVKHEVSRRIAAAKAVLDALRPEEIEARRAATSTNLVKMTAWNGDRGQKVDCPACGTHIFVDTEYVRTTAERIEESDIYSDSIYVATGLDCPVCRLALSGTAEVAATGLQQQYSVTTVESVADRYMEDAIDYDYGND